MSRIPRILIQLIADPIGLLARRAARYDGQVRAVDRRGRARRRPGQGARPVHPPYAANQLFFNQIYVWIAVSIAPAAVLGLGLIALARVAPSTPLRLLLAAVGGWTIFLPAAAFGVLVGWRTFGQGRRFSQRGVTTLSAQGIRRANRLVIVLSLAASVIEVLVERSALLNH
jgi:hypothetical protein